MFKKGSYNVKKAEKKFSTEPKRFTMTLKKKKKEASAEPKMTLKKKVEIKNVSKQESPEYHKKSYPKTVTTKKWVENKTFKKK